MSKAILIMDMPKCCGDCVFSNPDGDHCTFLGEVTLSEYGVCKKANCPLRELPERKETKCYDNDDWRTVVTKTMNEGWNACLKVIEGKTHEENT